MVDAVECYRLVQSNEDCRLTTVKAFVDVIGNLQQCGLCGMSFSIRRLYRIEVRRS